MLTANRSLRRPPLISGLPFLGNVVSLLENPHGFVQDAYEKYGPVFRFRALHREYIVLAGIHANRFVSGDGKHLFGVGSFWGQAGEYMGCPHMMVAVDGEIHRHQRNLMMPLLNQNRFKDRVDELALPVEAILKRFATLREVDAGGVLRQIVSNQISSALLGERHPYKTVQLMIYYFGSVMSVYGLRKWPAAMLKTPRFLYAQYITRQLVKQTLARSDARTPEEKAQRPTYLDALVPALRNKPEWYSEGDIAVHALLPFVAALDTVASTMGFVLYRLLSEPQLMMRIQREVDRVFCRRIPSIVELRELDDLNGVIKETLRLQPTGFGITRTATQDFEFEGYGIHKGEDILVFTTADHLNPKYFPNPNAFDIERYRMPRNEHKQSAYAPFGKGPHNCLGASLAEIMMPLNLGLLLNRLHIHTACDLGKVKLRFNPAPVLSNNFRVSMVNRQL